MASTGTSILIVNLVTYESNFVHVAILSWSNFAVCPMRILGSIAVTLLKGVGLKLLTLPSPFYFYLLIIY